VAKKTPQRKGALHATSHHILSTAGLIVMGTLVCASFLFTAFLTSPGLLSNQLAAVVTGRLVSLTNEDRSDTGLGTLTVNPVLVAAAQAKANDMASKGYFAHVSPDGRTSWSWFKDAGYAFSYAGENLAVDFTDSGDVNTAWLNSPTHRANIMNGHFTEIGIATAEGEYQGHKTTFVVQMFGTPAMAPQTLVATTEPQDAREPAVARAEPATDVLGTSVAPTEAAKSSTGNSVQPAAGEASVDTLDAPAIAQAGGTGATSWLGSPHDLLRDLYILIGLILLAALVIRTRMELKLHHMRHVAAVLVLIVVMSGLFVAADRFIFIPPTIGQGVSN
jgi:uncharacterized protein YkwD